MNSVTTCLLEQFFQQRRALVLWQLVKNLIGVDLLLPLVAAAEPVALVCETNETASSTLFTWLQDPFHVPRVTPLV